MFRAFWGGFFLKWETTMWGGIPKQQLKAKASENRPKTQKEAGSSSNLQPSKFHGLKMEELGPNSTNRFLKRLFNRRILKTPSLKQKNPTSNGFSPVGNKRLGNKSGFLKITCFFKRKIMFQACNSYNDHWTKQRQYQRFDGSFIRITYMKSPQKISIWFINISLYIYIYIRIFKKKKNIS